ncbi:MAG: peroxiredoxin [Opitutaceae bacterium]|jgi:peroxiredoxin Q/BCP
MRNLLGLLLTIGIFPLVRAEPLDVGATAPAVVGITEAGAKLDFGAVYKNGYTLVYFYPKAGTPGCTEQGCSLRDAYQDLAGKGVTVIGVSVDSVEEQKAFKEKYRFPFTLIADTNHEVIKAFGVPLNALWGTAARQAFLVNKAGRIVWRDLKVSPKQQAAEVLKAIK